MTNPWNVFGNCFLRSSSIRKRLRELPVLGDFLAWVGRRIVPQDTLVWIQVKNGPAAGIWLHLNPRFEAVYAGRNYEPAVEKALFSHIQPGNIFYDVGAHIGVFSLMAARLAGPRGCVFAFEPDPANLRRIEEHIERNQLPMIEPVSRAAWSSAGRARFERANPRSSLNRGSLAAVATVVSDETFEVETITLDEFSVQNSPPDLVKLDVEGAEAGVLRGADMIFRRFKPVLVCEIHHPQAASEVTQWLDERGYEWDWVEDIEDFPRHLLAKYRN
jgi:FkbM family methyltransferase